MILKALGHTIWRFLHEENVLWKVLFGAKYYEFSNGSSWPTPTHHGTSKSTWHFICRTIHLMTLHGHWCLGNGIFRFLLKRLLAHFLVLFPLFPLNFFILLFILMHRNSQLTCGLQIHMLGICIFVRISRSWRQLNGVICVISWLHSRFVHLVILGSSFCIRLWVFLLGLSWVVW